MLIIYSLFCFIFYIFKYKRYLSNIGNQYVNNQKLCITRGYHCFAVSFFAWVRLVPLAKLRLAGCTFGRVTFGRRYISLIQCVRPVVLLTILDYFVVSQIQPKSRKKMQCPVPRPNVLPAKLTPVKHTPAKRTTGETYYRRYALLSTNIPAAKRNPSKGKLPTFFRQNVLRCKYKPAKRTTGQT